MKRKNIFNELASHHVINHKNLPRMEDEDLRLVRYLSTNDPDKTDRDKYVNSIFGEVVQRTFAYDETFLLSRASAEYDVLLIGGSDPQRMGRFLRANRALLNDIARVAVVTGSTPALRARMLNAGFDDVFDIARTPVEEARVRAVAISRDHAITRHTQSSVGQMSSVLEPICNPTSLTPREFALLWLMATNLGRPVPVAQMAHEIAHTDPARFRRAIKVSMSNLRRKLLPGWRIETDLQGGYRLYQQD
jgi:DNA-binding response OmpR family regulator